MPGEVDRIIGQRIDTLRTKHGDTIKELADYLGISYTLMHDILSGRRKIRPSYLMRIAERYEVNIDYIYGRTDDPRPVFQHPQLRTLFRATRGLSEADLKKLNNVVQAMFPFEEEDEGGEQKGRPGGQPENERR